MMNAVSAIAAAAAAGLALTGCDETPADAPAKTTTQVADASGELVAQNRPDQQEPKGSAAAFVATGLCAPGEEVLFSCRLENNKIASVCGTKSKSGETVAQYRYGQPGQAPELAWPDANSPDRLKFASVPYSGGGEAQLHFLRGDIQYIVYSRVIRTNFAAGESNNPALDDGIFVRKADRIIARLACADRDVMPVDYEKAGRYADNVEDGIVELEY
jgi:hypothetical protein